MENFLEKGSQKRVVFLGC